MSLTNVELDHVANLQKALLTKIDTALKYPVLLDNDYLVDRVWWWACRLAHYGRNAQRLMAWESRRYAREVL